MVRMALKSIKPDASILKHWFDMDWDRSLTQMNQRKGCDIEFTVSMHFLIQTIHFAGGYADIYVQFRVPASSSVINTLRPRQNGRHFADDTFKRIFLNENVRISIKISLKIVPKGPIKNIPALVQIMAWRRPGDKPLSEPMIVVLLTHICVTWPQWVNLQSTDSLLKRGPKFVLTVLVDDLAPEGARPPTTMVAKRCGVYWVLEYFLMIQFDFADQEAFFSLVDNIGRNFMALLVFS